MSASPGSPSLGQPNSASLQSRLEYLLSIDLLTHISIVLREAKRLITFLINGTSTWVSMAFKLIAFTLVLTPGWIRMINFYLYDHHIIRNIEFGKGSLHRNILDLYLPSLPTTSTDNSKSPDRGNKKTGVPIIVFVSGGVWIIGNKLWSALVGRGFALMGYLVVVPDYRNFPQGDINDMCEDIKACLLWTIKNGSVYNGDINDITLSGQSAGAHLSFLTLFNIYEKRKLLCGPKQSGGNDTTTGTNPCDIVGTQSISKEEALTNDTTTTGGSATSAASESPIPLTRATLHNGMLSPNTPTSEGEGDLDNSYRTTLPQDGSGVSTASLTVKGDTTTNNNDDTGSKSDNDNGDDLIVRELDLVIIRCVTHLLLLNGPYDLVSLTAHLHQRGLDHSILQWIFKGDLEGASPTHRLMKYVPDATSSEGNHDDDDDNSDGDEGGDDGSVWSLFPAVTLMCCSEDKSVPRAQASELYAALTSLSISVNYVMYANKNHTSLILEDPLAGNYSFFYDAHTYMKARRRNKYSLRDCSAPTIPQRGGRKEGGKGGERGGSGGGEKEGIKVKGRMGVLEEAQAFIHPTLAAIAKSINPF